MGKHHPSPSPGEAAAYLTLRSGRRVPVAAACSPPPGRRHRRGPACCRRCGGSKLACGSRSPGQRKSRLGGGRPEKEEELPSSPSGHPAAGEVAVDGSDEPNMPLAGDEVRANHERLDSKSGVAGQPSPPVMEAEMEAFFAAAELAERRRFAAAYNYDIALDRPLEGRFEWTPLGT